jgi:hypothetical protein
MTTAFALLLGLQSLSANATATAIPTQFEADRVFATPQTMAGQPLKLYTDTGGGANLLCRDAALRLQLEVALLPPDPELEGELGKGVGTTALPGLRAGSEIPANADGDANFLVPDCTSTGGKFAASMGEGLLSSRWFAGRTWTWNYPAHTLTLEDRGWKPDASARRTTIGFRAASANSPAFHMPRITARVDHQNIDLLLDTGATGYPTAAAQRAQGGDLVGGARATSFITTSVLEGWHRAHPDWSLVDDGDVLFAPRFHARLIRVPHVTIGGWSVGPVWFTERPDGNFRQVMSSMTDRPIDGALGGNALAHFAMTIDYPAGAAYFRCVRDCKATPPPAP